MRVSTMSKDNIAENQTETTKRCTSDRNHSALRSKQQEQNNPGERTTVLARSTMVNHGWSMVNHGSTMVDHASTVSHGWTMVNHALTMVNHG